GEKYHYSNLGFILLYRIIEEIGKKPYPQVLDSLVFRPAGMTQTIDLHSEAPQDTWVPGYKKDEENGGVKMGDMRFSQRFRSGDWTSTASDLRNLLSKAEKWDALYTNDTLQHGGATSGYRSYVFHARQSGHKVIFLSNYANIPFLRLAEDLALILNGQPVEMPKELYRISIPLSGGWLENYAGEYLLEAEQNTAFQFKVRVDTLFFQDDELGWIPLQAEDSASFFFDPRDPETFRFLWDSTAQHYDLELIIEGGMAFPCPRVE
ncbi:MAG: serine hydrolase domain-containing protein, partial [Bacteroidota bacterium]